MEYLLKASVVIIIFYGFYKLLLQGHTFFKTNRVFLLLGIFISFCLPFIVIPNYVLKPLPTFNYDFNTPVVTHNTIDDTFSITRILLLIYATGIVFFTIRLIIQVCSLVYFIKCGMASKQDKYTYVKTAKDTSPFSFFNWIIYNPELFNEEELKQIIIHEKVHAKQYHTLDILIAQLACVVFWFNPVVWLYTMDLKQNLEFIADENAQRKSHCKKSYQYTLLKTSMPTHQLAITTNFYNSLIKKRIVMLHKSQSKKTHVLTYFLILPILSLFLMGFNRQTVYITKTSETGNILKVIDSNKVRIVFDKNLSDADIENIKAKLKKQHITLTCTNLKRNAKDEIISISVTFKSKNGVTTWNAYEDKKPIAPFYFYKSEDGMGVGQLQKGTRIHGINGIHTGQETPLIIIDNHVSTKDSLEIIDPNSIHNISVIKYGEAIKTYGNKGKHGVIVVSTQKSGIKISSDNPDAKPTYIVDGKRVSADDFNKIDPENIERINVIKGDNAVDVYKDDVIEITTKNKK